MSLGKITITRITTRQLLDHLRHMSSNPMRKRVIYLTPLGDERLRKMEDLTGVSLTQMVNDLIKDYYNDGFKNIT